MCRLLKTHLLLTHLLWHLLCCSRLDPALRDIGRLAIAGMYGMLCIVHCQVVDHVQAIVVAPGLEQFVPGWVNMLDLSAQLKFVSVSALAVDVSECWQRWASS